MRDAEYYERRERLELELAAKANSDTVRDIHLGFAKRYANLAAAKKAAPQTPFVGRNERNRHETRNF